MSEEMYKSKTLYDDVFRTLMTNCRQLILPVLNEIFGEHYTGNEEVIPLSNELMIPAEDKKVITDSNFAVVSNGIKKRYHIECQSSNDDTMAMRMFEYDINIGIQDKEIKGNSITVEIPKSAIIYLRSDDKTPNHVDVNIVTPGGSVSYEIKALKNDQYHIDDIIKKNLLFLIPFHIFSYEKDLANIERDTEKLNDLENVYEKIFDRLSDLKNDGVAEGYMASQIFELTREVTKKITEKYSNVFKEVTDMFGGKVLTLESDRLINKGREEGLEEGLKKGRAEGREETEQEFRFKDVERIQNMILEWKVSFEEACRMMGLSSDDFVKAQNEMKLIEQNKNAVSEQNEINRTDIRHDPKQR